MELTETLTAQINNLKNRAGEFAGIFDQFQRIKGYLVNNPALLAEWENAYVYANGVKNTVSWINGQVDSAVNWLSRTFGLGNIPKNNLGALPLISAAYVISATAALVFASDWMMKIIKAAEIEQAKIDLVKDGKASETILFPAKEGIFNSLFGDTGSILKWVIIGGAAWYLLPKLLKKD